MKKRQTMSGIVAPAFHFDWISSSKAVFPDQVPESHYPTCFRCLPGPSSLIQMSGSPTAYHQGLHQPVSDPFTWFRCVGVWKHPKNKQTEKKKYKKLSGQYHC